MLGYPRFWGYVDPLQLLLPMAGEERKKGMSALLNHGFGGWFNHRPFRE
jgi:hypothetical protein